MPLCVKCQNPFVCDCSGVPKPLGTVAENCPLDKKPAAIWVHVVDDRGIDVGKVGATNDGVEKPTAEDSGTAKFDPVDPGPHTIDLSPLTSDLQSRFEKLPAPTERKIKVAPGEIAYVPYQFARKPTLKVKVVKKGEETRLFTGATVTLTGPESPPAKPTTEGIADFKTVAAGKYTVNVKLSDEDAKNFATTLDFDTAPVDIELFAGREEEVVVYAEAINLVKPKIDLEYRVVLLDRKLSDKQGAGEAKIEPSATYIQATIVQSNPDHAYAKTGKLKFTPAHVDVFLDEACTQPLTADLTAIQLIGTSDQIVGAKPPRYWLRGKDKGRFTVELVLADPADRFVKLDPTAVPPEKMGVVNLELKLHQQDLVKLKDAAMQVDPDTDPEATYHTNLKAKAIPDQVVMSPEEKIGVPTAGDAAKPGRLLHAQDAGHFGRAKLIVAKIDPTELPEEAEVDQYDIVLNFGRGSAPDAGPEALKPLELQGGDKDTPKSGALEFFDAEVEGAKKDTVTYKISVLKAAEQTIWVEGKTETDQPCDVRVDAGMDRAVAGLEKKAKRNGDWTRFTVVKIGKPEIVDPRTPNSTEPTIWNAGDKEYYINMKTGPDGTRKIKISAKLTKPLKNVTLHLMLAPDKKNRKTDNWGVDMPGTWTWNAITKDVKVLDKADRKDFLHLSEKTDVDGKAVKELTLSRFGGDKFWPGAYLEQDPHLAKYVDGHTDLEKRKPVVPTEPFTVWRRFAYQRVDVEGRVYPEFGAAENAYKLVKARMFKVAAAAKTQVEINALPLPSLQAEYNYEVNGGNDLRLNVSDANQSQFFGLVTAEAEHPIKVPIVSCDFNWANERESAAVVVLPEMLATAFPQNVTTDVHVCERPLQGGDLLFAGDWSAYDWDAAANGGVGAAVNQRNGQLAAGDVGVDRARPNINDVQLRLPAGVGATNATTKITITGLVVKGAADDYLGGYNCDAARSKAIVAIYDPTDPVDFQNTIIHELGHAFFQTLRTPPATGIPINPNFLSTPTGPHCTYNGDKCVMFTEGPIVGCLNQYCPDCHPHLLVQDMTKVKA
jgi:hypothetical protein